VGLAEKAMNFPDELSGGQKQRIAIARALAMNPEIILLDEPTSALDPTMVGEVQAVIRELARTGKTMMIVTHEMNFARAISNRVFYMDEGGIYEEGDPVQIFEHPQKEKTRWFIRRLKVLELEIHSRQYDLLGMQSEIRDYALRNQIAPRMSGRIQLAFEELVHQILMPRIPDPDIRVTIEYSAEKETAAISVQYNGAPLDPSVSENELSLSVLKGITTDLSFELNRVILQLRD